MNKVAGFCATDASATKSPPRESSTPRWVGSPASPLAALQFLTVDTTAPFHCPFAVTANFAPNGGWTYGGRCGAGGCCCVCASALPGATRATPTTDAISPIRTDPMISDRNDGSNRPPVALSRARSVPRHATDQGL